MTLRDHNYVIPNTHLQDHTYAQQLPVVQIQPQQEEDRPAPDEEQEVSASDDEQEDGAQELVIDAEPRTYITIPGIRLNSKFYVDNLGYKYYRKKLLVNRISLICERRKIPRGRMCHGLASISRNEVNNQLSIVTPHNHYPESIDLDVPFLRNALGERAVDHTSTTPPIRGLYNSEIIKHPKAAINYTLLQTQSRAKRMRQSRRPQLPRDNHKLS